MKAYHMYTDDRYKLFDLKQNQGFILTSISPEWQLGPGWNPPDVILAPDKGGPPRILGDYSNLITLPMFSQKAIDALSGILEPNGEFLPVICKEVSMSYFVYNITKLIDVDENRSLIRKNRLGRVKWIDKPVFCSDSLNDIYIFKVRQLPIQIPSVTDQFVQRVQEAGLTGFYFKEIWSDEEGDES